MQNVNKTNRSVVIRLRKVKKSFNNIEYYDQRKDEKIKHGNHFISQITNL